LKGLLKGLFVVPMQIFYNSNKKHFMLYMIGLPPMASPQVLGPMPLDFPYRPRRYSDVVFCFKKWRW
jgi:hypothetical protein